MGEGNRGFVLRPGESRAVDLVGGISLKASGEDTGAAFSLLETSDDADSGGPPMHVHRDAAESFYILEGEYAIFLDDQEFSCPAGSFVFIPAGIPHGLRVGKVTSRKLNLYTPAAMVGYFRDLRKAIRSGTADEALLREIAGQYSMDMVGPVPEGYL